MWHILDFTKCFHWIQQIQWLVVTVKWLEPATSCVRCYRRASKTQVTNRIFKLTLIHASVNYQIRGIRWIHWIPHPFMENWTAPVECKMNWTVYRSDIYLECESVPPASKHRPVNVPWHQRPSSVRRVTAERRVHGVVLACGPELHWFVRRKPGSVDSVHKLTDV